MIERYADQRITDIFSAESVIERWTKVELAAMRVLGNDPGEVKPPNPQAVADEESVTKHDVVGFLRALIKTNPDNAVLRRWVHYGLTSSNVVDCGLHMALVEVEGQIRGELMLLIKTTDWVHRGLMSVDQIGRTHGRTAVRRPASYPWVVVTQGLERSLGRLSRTRINAGSLAGPVGVSRVFDSRIEAAGLRELGLERLPGTQLVPRDELAHWVQVLALIATQCEAIAIQTRLLAQSGIDEVAEGRSLERVGSSAMPHKHNPIGAENICGLARLARMQVDPILLGVVQWGDHDLVHSSVERVAVPDLCHLICTILIRTRILLEDLDWDFNRIRANLREAKRLGANSHAELLSRVEKDEDYLDAHLNVVRDPLTQIPNREDAIDG